MNTKRTRLTCAFFAGIIFMAGCGISEKPFPSSTQGANDPPPTNYFVDAESFEQQLNTFRRVEGLRTLERNPKLDNAAYFHAQDMTRRRFFSHVSTDGPNGNILPERVMSQGCLPTRVAENLAVGHRTETEVFELWLASPAHKRALLGAAFKTYGVARVNRVWVLVLASGCSQKTG